MNNSRVNIKPLVSIGVPVFNGEKGLARALDSLLQQDYPLLEIIISDNASTDATPMICQEYVRRDSRVKYFPSEVNRGSAWNFNRVFELSTGKYFMWAAHDDVRELSFVSVCVAKMEQCPEAVLCQAHTTMFIEGRQEILCITHLNSFNGLTGIITRYRETLRHFPAMSIYGLYRSSAMRKTLLFQRHIATDIAFIQELSIYGDFVQVPEMLFNYFNRIKWNTVDQDYKTFLGTGRKPWWYLPFIVLFINHWKRVARASIPITIKLRLWVILLEEEVRHVALKVLLKTGRTLCPAKWKDKLGSAIYWRWMHNRNVNVVNQELFKERVIKPQLGWSR